MEALTTKAPSLSCLPTSWPTGSQSTGAPSLRAATSAPRSQPIYSSWLGLGGWEGILLLLAHLEALFWRQFSWLKASLLFVFHILVLFQLIVTWCMVFFCIFRLDFPLGLFVHPLVLYTSILAMPYESVGRCYPIGIDTLSTYSRLTLLLILSSSTVKAGV
jgi:hypothetical protein